MCSNCCKPKKLVYSCYTPCQQTNYCYCNSCKPKCCPKEEKCCIAVDYTGTFLPRDSNCLSPMPPGLFLQELTNNECKLLKSDGIHPPDDVIPTKTTTKFLDCNTKNLYKLVLNNETIKCTLIKNISKDDCLELLCTSTKPKTQ